METSALMVAREAAGGLAVPGAHLSPTPRATVVPKQKEALLPGVCGTGAGACRVSDIPLLPWRE